MLGCQLGSVGLGVAEGELVGDRLGVGLPLRVEVGVGEGELVGLLLAVIVGVGVGVGVGVTDSDVELVGDALGVAEGVSCSWLLASHSRSEKLQFPSRWI